MDPGGKKRKAKRGTVENAKKSKAQPKFHHSASLEEFGFAKRKEDEEDKVIWLMDQSEEEETPKKRRKQSPEPELTPQSSHQTTMLRFVTSRKKKSQTQEGESSSSCLDGSSLRSDQHGFAEDQGGASDGFQYTVECSSSSGQILAAVEVEEVDTPPPTPPPVEGQERILHQMDPKDWAALPYSRKWDQPLKVVEMPAEKPEFDKILLQTVPVDVHASLDWEEARKRPVRSKSKRLTGMVRANRKPGPKHLLLTREEINSTLTLLEYRSPIKELKDRRLEEYKRDKAPVLESISLPPLEEPPEEEQLLLDMIKVEVITTPKEPAAPKKRRRRRSSVLCRPKKRRKNTPIALEDLEKGYSFCEVEVVSQPIPNHVKPILRAARRISRVAMTRVRSKQRRLRFMEQPTKTVPITPRPGYIPGVCKMPDSPEKLTRKPLPHLPIDPGADPSQEAENSKLDWLMQTPSSEEGFQTLERLEAKERDRQLQNLLKTYPQYPQLKDLIQAFKEKKDKKMSWTEKFAPNLTKELVGAEEAVKTSRLWLRRWHKKLLKTCRQQQRPKQQTQGRKKKRSASESSDSSWKDEEEEDEEPNPLVVEGGLGAGKSHFLKLLAREEGFKLLEIGSDELRTAKEFERKVEGALGNHRLELQKSQEGRGSIMEAFARQRRSRPRAPNPTSPKFTLILIEDADVVLGPDRNFWAGIRNLVGESKVPVALTVSDLSMGTLGLAGTYQTVSFPKPDLEWGLAYFQAVSLVGANLLSPLAPCQDWRQSLLHLEFWFRDSGIQIPAETPRPDNPYKGANLNRMASLADCFSCLDQVDTKRQLLNGVHPIEAPARLMDGCEDAARKEDYFINFPDYKGDFGGKMEDLKLEEGWWDTVEKAKCDLSHFYSRKSFNLDLAPFLHWVCVYSEEERQRAKNKRRYVHLLSELDLYDEIQPLFAKQRFNC